MSNGIPEFSIRQRPNGGDPDGVHLARPMLDACPIPVLVLRADGPPAYANPPARPTSLVFRHAPPPVWK